MFEVNAGQAGVSTVIQYLWLVGIMMEKNGVSSGMILQSLNSSNQVQQRLNTKDKKRRPVSSNFKNISASVSPTKASSLAFSDIRHKMYIYSHLHPCQHNPIQLTLD